MLLTKEVDLADALKTTEIVLGHAPAFAALIEKMVSEYFAKIGPLVITGTCALIGTTDDPGKYFDLDFLVNPKDVTFLYQVALESDLAGMTVGLEPTPFATQVWFENGFVTVGATRLEMRHYRNREKLAGVDWMFRVDTDPNSIEDWARTLKYSQMGLCPPPNSPPPETAWSKLFPNTEFQLRYAKRFCGQNNIPLGTLLPT